MGGVRLVDPLEQSLLDESMIEQVSVDDLRTMSPAVFAQLDRLDTQVDKIYIHIDMDVLDPREVSAHVNKVPNGPSSEQLARLFEAIFARYPESVGDRLRDDSADRRGRPFDRGAQSHDRWRNSWRAGARASSGEAVGRVATSSTAQTGTNGHKRAPTGRRSKQEAVVPLLTLCSSG